jgi:hypothetical protein
MTGILFDEAPPPSYNQGRLLPKRIPRGERPVA